MTVRVRTLRHAGIAIGLLVMASAAALPQSARSAADGGGMPVMSDTPQWCAHLAAQVAALRQTLTGPHVEADKLAQEGRRLCGTGHVRLGLSRLRYALIELREH